MRVYRPLVSDTNIYEEKPYMIRRDLDDVLDKNHKSNLTNITPDIDPSVLFAGTKDLMTSCMYEVY